jgi:penicillin amidase
VPSLRYISHLNAPGLSVIGAGEPFLPGISIGHNGTIAFGLTRFYIDQEDLYAYETDPAQPHEYKYKGRWEPMETVTEQIAVRGEATPRKVTIDFTRHGPVLYADTKNNRAWRCARRGSTSAWHRTSGRWTTCVPRTGISSARR